MAELEAYDPATSLPDHDCEELTDSIVQVNGTRIPVGDVDVYVRNEGPLDFTRYAEGEFPSPWDGVDWANAFHGFDPIRQEEWDVVTIDVLDHATKTYYRAFTGVVTGVGSTADSGEKWFSFRAQGLGQLLNKIPAEKTFEGATVKDVLSYVADELSKRTPLDVTVNGGEQEVESGLTVTDVEMGWQPIFDPSKLVAKLLFDINSPKRFHFGDDTLADVVNWVTEKADTRIFVAGTQDKTLLVSAENSTISSHNAQYLGGDLYIENNDALSELRPLNTMLVKAEAKESRPNEKSGDLTPNDRGHDDRRKSEQKASTKFVEAKAVHDELYRRAGEQEFYADVHRLSDSMTKTEVQNEARKKLTKAIEKPTEGTMQTLLRGPVTPFDTIEAKPTCDGSQATDLPSVTYQVARVHHKVRASEISSTEMNVGVKVDSQDDITVYDSWETSP